MKNLIFLMLVVFSTTAHAQEITELKEAVVIAPNVHQIVNGSSDMNFVVLEKSYAEFSEDPIAFMKANFNIHEFIRATGDKNYDSYIITFRSERGTLEADFDKEGRITENRQLFKDVQLPLIVQQELLKDHTGWTIEKNKRFSKGQGESTEKIVYRIKLNNGDKVRRVKIVPDLRKEVVVADN